MESLIKRKIGPQHIISCHETDKNGKDLATTKQHERQHEQQQPQW